MVARGVDRVASRRLRKALCAVFGIWDAPCTIFSQSAAVMQLFTFAVVGDPSPSSTTLVDSHSPILIGGPCASIAVEPTSTRLHLNIERMVFTSSDFFRELDPDAVPRFPEALTGTRRLLRRT